MSPRDIVFRKNYPLTWALEQDPALVQADSALQALAGRKFQALADAADSREALVMSRFTEEELVLSASRLGALSGQLSALVSALREQGCSTVDSYFLSV